MEPRNWKWIQAAVIAVAMAVGIGVAVWYQNRPLEMAIPAPAAMPDRKMVLHPLHPDLIPTVAPVKPSAGSFTTSAVATGNGAAPAVGSPAAAVSVPSQSSVNSWQKEAVDPMAHLQVSPVPGSAVASGFPTVSSPSPPGFGVPTAGASSGVPSAFPPASSTGLPGSSTAPSSSTSTGSVSPFVDTTPPAGGTPASAGGAPTSGTSPFAGTPGSAAPSSSAAPGAFPGSPGP